MMNKKGGTLINWIFTIAIIMLLVIILQSEILDELNNKYNNSFSTGLNTSAFDDLQTLKQNLNTDEEGSGVTTGTTDGGIGLLSSISMLKKVSKTLKNFIDGTFIMELINILNLPTIIGKTLIIMIWVSIILIIIYIIYKVPT